MNLTRSLLLAVCTLLSLPALSNPNEELLEQAFSFARMASKKMDNAGSSTSYQQAVNDYQLALNILTRMSERDKEKSLRIKAAIADVIWNMGVCYELMAAFFETIDAEVEQARSYLTRSLEHFDRAFALYIEADVHWTALRHRRFVAYVDSVRARLARLAPPVPAAAVLEAPPPAPAPVLIEVVERRKKRKQSEPKRSLNPILAANSKAFHNFGFGS